MSIPCGLSEGLPIGMMFIARRHEESVLFEIAYAYEQATGHRPAPARVSSDGDDREVPPMDVEAFNAMGLALGRAAYEQVLRDAESRFELSASIFRTITSDVLERGGWGWLHD